MGWGASFPKATVENRRKIMRKESTLACAARDSAVRVIVQRHKYGLPLRVTVRVEDGEAARQLGGLQENEK